LNLQPEKQDKSKYSTDQSKPSKFRQLSTSKAEECTILNRPGIEAFLIALSACYNLYALSCWSTHRAGFIMQKACINKFFMGIFEKKSNVFLPGKSQRRGRVLAESSKTLFIDSSREQINKNHANGILLRPFTNSDKDDDDLLQLLPFLIYVSQFDDVRPIKHYYGLYSQQAKNIIGSFGPFVMPEESEQNIRYEDVDDDEEEEQETSSKVSAILSSHNSGSINELKSRIMKGHITSANTKSFKECPSKASTHAESTGKFSFRCLMEKDTLGDFNESTQNTDLFSRTHIKTYNQSKKFD